MKRRTCKRHAPRQTVAPLAGGLSAVVSFQSPRRSLRAGRRTCGASLQGRDMLVRRSPGGGAGVGEPHLLAAPPWLCRTARQPPECGICKPGGLETPPAWGGTRAQAARSPPRGAAAPASSGWPTFSRTAGAGDEAAAGQRPAKDGSKAAAQQSSLAAPWRGGARLGARTCCKAAVSPPLSSRVGARRGRCGRGSLIPMRLR